MSELEKQQRNQYQERRNKYILIQKIILIALTVLLIACSIVCIRLDKSTYVHYTENGNAIHKAYLSENDFYTEKYLNGSHAYVASLVDRMTADFSYDLIFDTDKVDFKYNYRIDAQLEIKDKASAAPIYNPTDEIVPLTTSSSTGNKLTVKRLVEIDYQKYNNAAKAYVDEFGLKDTVNTLIVRMYVDVVGKSETFAADRSGEYVTELRVPLTKTVFKPEVTTTIPAGEQKILAINESYKNVFLTLSVIFGVLDVIAAGFLVFFVISTRNKHIDYRRRVDRTLKNYKSYIQQTTTFFDFCGYHVFSLGNISELLDVRDTLQKPILAYENEDQTCARFFIVAEAGIAYLYEIRVEDDDTEESTPAKAVKESKTPVAAANSSAPVSEPVSDTVSACTGDEVEVIDVKFPEADKDYKYDPDGESLHAGDVVLVPSADNYRGTEVEREATVSVGNHRVPKSSLKHSLKKIIRVVKRAMSASLEEKTDKEAK